MRSKHGIILSCALRAPDLPADVTGALGQLGTSAEGKIYGRWPPSERAHDGSAVCDVERWLADMLS